MAVHFTNFGFASASHVLTGFSIAYPGGDTPYELDIVVYSQPLDRYSSVTSLTRSVVVELAATQLQTLPVDYDGFIVERSDDGGATWSDVSGVVRDSFFYVDSSLSVGTYQYRAKMRMVTGTTSSAGNEVEIYVGSWDDKDKLGLLESNIDGSFVNEITRDATFPQGFDGLDHSGLGISEGSLFGVHASGSWYIGTYEEDPPVVSGHSPACASPAVALPLTVITYTIQDQPYPAGGSGIDDTYTTITLSVTSQHGGSAIVIRQGTNQPYSPTVTCVIANGAVPALDRDVTITVPAGYIQSDDDVVIKTWVRDLQGNSVVQECTFTMDHADIVSPTITNTSPDCGSGVSDSNVVERDAQLLFNVSDSDSGIDLTTLDVYVKEGAGPYQQVLSAGSVWLLGYYGIVTSDGASGYNVVINRPVTSKTWPADTQICYRVEVDDVATNSSSQECCFKTEAAAQIVDVYVVAEDILLVEFSIGMSDIESLRNTDLYTIAPTSGLASDAVTVKEVLPQVFVESDADLGQEFISGNKQFPRFCFVHTSPHSHWKQYTITLEYSALPDKYGDALSSSGNTATYRGKRTKFDGGRDIAWGQIAVDDSNTRRVLSALFWGQDGIGGTHLTDDWDIE